MSNCIETGEPACVVMDRKLWDGVNRYFLSIPPRISVHAQQADDACVQFQIDVLGRDRIGAVKGSLTPHGSFAAMAYCDSPLNKLVLLSALTEAALFYDDCDLPPADEFTKPCKYIEKRTVLWGAGEDETVKTSFKRAVSKLAAQVAEADPVRGPELIGSLDDWRVGESLLRGRFHEYTTLEGYCKDRIPDIGWGVLQECAIFGSGIDITMHERKSADQVFEPLYQQGVYGNDLLSWDKEIDAHQRTGERLINSVVLLQRWHGMTVEEAKAALKQKALECDKEYQRRKEEFFQSPTSPSMRWWFHIVESIAAAGQIWHMFSYRHQDPHGSGYMDYFQKRSREGAFRQKMMTVIRIT